MHRTPPRLRDVLYVLAAPIYIDWVESRRVRAAQRGELRALGPRFVATALGRISDAMRRGVVLARVDETSTAPPPYTPVPREGVVYAGHRGAAPIAGPRLVAQRCSACAAHAAFEGEFLALLLPGAELARLCQRCVDRIGAELGAWLADLATPRPMGPAAEAALALALGACGTCGAPIMRATGSSAYIAAPYAPTRFVCGACVAATEATLSPLRAALATLATARPTVSCVCVDPACRPEAPTPIPPARASSARPIGPGLRLIPTPAAGGGCNCPTCRARGTN